jgi:hypothetical protein
MIAPLRSISPGRSSRVRATRPEMLVSITCASGPHSACCSGASGEARPALFSSRSTAPVSAAKASIAARSRMSSATGRKASPSSPASASSRSLRRPVPITSQPSATNRRAAAWPKPEVAPVMRAVLVMADS